MVPVDVFQFPKFQLIISSYFKCFLNAQILENFQKKILNILKIFQKISKNFFKKFQNFKKFQKMLKIKKLLKKNFKIYQLLEIFTT